MSQGTYLVCETTKQVVHVSEFGGAGLSGPDYPILVGAFCQAHFGQQLAVIGENWSIGDYTEWTLENVEQQFMEIAPTNQSMIPSIREACRKYRKGG